MRILFLIMVSSTMMLFGCDMDRKTKKVDEECVINTTEQYRKGKPLLSVSVLKERIGSQLILSKERNTILILQILFTFAPL